jgi:hypothetical protein
MRGEFRRYLEAEEDIVYRPCHIFALLSHHNIERIFFTLTRHGRHGHVFHVFLMSIAIFHNAARCICYAFEKEHRERNGRRYRFDPSMRNGKKRIAAFFQYSTAIDLKRPNR